MCAQLPVTYNLWEGTEDDWITVETCSPIVISENKCSADVKNWFIYNTNSRLWVGRDQGWNFWERSSKLPADSVCMQMCVNTPTGFLGYEGVTSPAAPSREAQRKESL